MVNPRILSRGASSWDTVGIEGCLSIPDYIAVVRRNRCIDVAYDTLDGREVRARITGIVQCVDAPSRLYSKALGVFAAVGPVTAGTAFVCAGHPTYSDLHHLAASTPLCLLVWRALLTRLPFLLLLPF